MAKALDAPYVAGRRGSAWLKVKPSFTADLVVLAAEWGHGRRRGWLSNLHLGARDPETGDFVMVGKTFKGLTDELLTWQTKELQDIATAKRICAVCPVMVSCLEGAIERREPWGVWGGQLFLNGKILASKRRRGRPPKNPRPEDQLPEVPIPVHLVGRVELRTA